MAKPLAEQFAAALKPNARATDIEALIDLAQVHLADAVEQQRVQHDIAVDVHSSDETADAAAEAETRAARRIVRLTAQIVQLTDRAETIRKAELRKSGDLLRAAALADRDQLVAELRAEWPLIEAKMIDFILRIIALDKRCGQNDSAEALARGVPTIFNLHGGQVARLINMKIPRFTGDVLFPAWPPPRAEFDNLMINPAAMSQRLAEASDAVRQLANVASQTKLPA